MTDKIFILQCSGGEWEDKWTDTIKASHNWDLLNDIKCKLEQENEEEWLKGQKVANSEDFNIESLTEDDEYYYDIFMDGRIFYKILEIELI